MVTVYTQHLSLRASGEVAGAEGGLYLPRHRAISWAAVGGADAGC